MHANTQVECNQNVAKLNWKLNNFVFLSARKLTFIVRLDNAKTAKQSFKIEPVNAFMVKTTLTSPPNPSPPKLFCQETHGYPFYGLSQFGIWIVFAFPSQTAFPYVKLLKRRQAATWEERCTSLASPESGGFAVFVHNRNLWNFLYNCDAIDA